jgi:hypothetical protein
MSFEQNNSNENPNIPNTFNLNSAIVLIYIKIRDLEEKIAEAKKMREKALHNLLSKCSPNELETVKERGKEIGSNENVIFNLTIELQYFQQLLYLIEKGEELDEEAKKKLKAQVAGEVIDEQIDSQEKENVLIDIDRKDKNFMVTMTRQISKLVHPDCNPNILKRSTEDQDSLSRILSLLTDWKKTVK